MPGSGVIPMVASAPPERGTIFRLEKYIKGYVFHELRYGKG